MTTTTLQEQLELMRERMRQMADNEQKLVRGLGEALNVADERLREQVRQFAMEHNQRRTVALEELRALSARLGALPKGRYEQVRQSAQPLEAERYVPRAPQHQAPYQQAPYQPPQSYAPQPGYEQPPAAAHQPAPQAPADAAWGQQPAQAAGDWRRAASRIEEEISLYQNQLKARR